MNWDFEKTYITCIYVILFLRWNGLFGSFTCFSCCHRWLFPSTGWCFLLVLRIVFCCFRRNRDSFNMLWYWFIAFCVAFYSCLGLRKSRGRQQDRQGGSSVEAYWCGRERCLEMNWIDILVFSHFFCYWSRLSFDNIDLYKYLWLFLLVVKLH